MRTTSLPLQLLFLLKCLEESSSFSPRHQRCVQQRKKKGRATSLCTRALRPTLPPPTCPSSSRLLLQKGDEGEEDDDEDAPSLVLREDEGGKGASSHQRISSEEVQLRLERELRKLRRRDRSQSQPVRHQDLKIVYEDDHIVLVDKPSGVLTVPSEPGVPSLVQSVYERFLEQQSPVCRAGGDGIGTTGAGGAVRTLLSTASPSFGEPVSKMGQMVVHRLGMETSGLVIFAKTMDAVRGMNSLFRLRRVTRQYEALVCGHVRKDQGLINLPLMRDFEFPPYMRVSTDELQRVLADLDPEIVGSKLLEAPKASLTHYQVKSREYLRGQPDLPVTRLILTSITGRTHQLNVHMAAFGHPIVRDSVYGAGGGAAPFGGLKPSRSLGTSTVNLEQAISSAASDLNMCVHASCVKFTHPVAQDFLSFTSDAPF